MIRPDTIDGQLDTGKYTAGIRPINFKLPSGCGAPDLSPRACREAAATGSWRRPSVRFAVDDKVTRGEVPKWSQRARLESGLGPNQPHVGSNPTLSANYPVGGPLRDGGAMSMPSPNPDLRIVSDLEELGRACAGEFARLARQAGPKRPFTVALSGGTTPRGAYTRLTQDPYRNLVPWPSLQFFWGDERHVPPDHPDSNYRMALESLLSKVPVPPDPVLRNAASVIVLVSGDSKAAALQRALAPEGSVDECPARLLLEARGRIVVIADRAAARLVRAGG